MLRLEKQRLYIILLSGGLLVVAGLLALAFLALQLGAETNIPLYLTSFPTQVNPDTHLIRPDGAPLEPQLKTIGGTQHVVTGYVVATSLAKRTITIKVEVADGWPMVVTAHAGDAEYLPTAILEGGQYRDSYLVNAVEVEAVLAALQPGDQVRVLTATTQNLPYRLQGSVFPSRTIDMGQIEQITYSDQ